MISYFAIPGIPQIPLHIKKLTLLSDVQNNNLTIALDYFNSTLADVQKKTKAPMAVYQRAIISYVIYMTSKLTLHEIAIVFCCSYSSIDYYKKVVSAQLSAKRDNSYKIDVAAILSLITNKID